MISDAAPSWQASAWDIITRLAQADGSAVHGWSRRLAAPGASQRDLADAVHLLCAVHGRLPCMIGETLHRGIQPETAAWLEQAAAGFAAERAYLSRLTAHAGPLPSTPGQAETEAAVIGQRHALEMLARSDRAGCATGAVAALIADWHAIRATLDAAAARFGVAAAPVILPSDAATAAVVAATPPASERAITFGAQQIFAQHRGLWDLIEARASARGDS